MFRLFRQPTYKAGDLVRIKSSSDILATLDDNGALDGMPFMPEMLSFCGTSAVVVAVAHKTCDTVNYSGIRYLPDTIHLKGLRCNGTAHGGCQADCLLFWKSAWIEPVKDAGQIPEEESDVQMDGAIKQLERLSSYEDPTDQSVRYYCQVTEILRATQAWRWWNPAQYLLDVSSRNSSLSRSTAILFLAMLRKTIPITAYRLQIKLYNYIAKKTDRPTYDEVHSWRGTIEVGDPTPTADNGLSPGDWVRIKPLHEISTTLNKQGRNKGMFFDTDMIPYCDRQYQVKDVVTKLIEEGTGKMMHLNNPCVTLAGVVCKSEYADKRLLCPRAIRPYWRPIWLEKTNVLDEKKDGEVTLSQ